MPRKFKTVFDLEKEPLFEKLDIYVKNKLSSQPHSIQVVLFFIYMVLKCLFNITFKILLIVIMAGILVFIHSFKELKKDVDYFSEHIVGEETKSIDFKNRGE